MDMLKLAALDAEDLKVIAAHAQDAVGKVGDIVWRPAERRLTIELNRYVWEKAGGHGKERRRSLLHFARVEAVKSAHIRRDFPDAVVSLLTVRFEGRDDDPSGVREDGEPVVGDDDPSGLDDDGIDVAVVDVAVVDDGSEQAGRE